MRSAAAPLAVDVGYGASHTTTVEWAGWLRQIRPDIEVVGLEINPERVLPPRDGVRFELGGFELAGYRPHLVRAFNVLRQYDVDQVPDVWRTVCAGLAPAACSSRAPATSWGGVAHGCFSTPPVPAPSPCPGAPSTPLTPRRVAERLPKARIHRNVPGEPIHQFLADADAAWERASGWDPHGPRVRWRHALEDLARDWPVHPQQRRLADNFVTVDWQAVAPAS